MKTKNKTLMRRAKILLWDAELTVTGLALRIHRSRTWTSLVLYGHVKSKATRRAIASILGEYIWEKAA